jgi:hypothetical protein
MDQKLNSLALGYAAAIVSAICMLLLGILANLGIYTSAAEMMQKWHIFFSLSPGGIISGMIEAAIISFIFIYLFGWCYNRLAK